MPTSADPHGPEILLCVHSFEPGGVEQIALRLAAVWRAAGARATVFLGRDDGAMAGRFAGRVTLDRAPATRWPIRHIETLWMILHLARRLRRAPPALLFAPGNSYAVVAVAMKLLLGRACPPIALKVSNDLVRRDMGPLARAGYGLWVRVQGRFIDHFIAISEALAYQIARQARVAPDRIHYLPNPALDPARPAPAPAPLARDPAGGRSFCYVGRLVGQKNLPLLLRAFARGMRPGDRLAFYGDGPQRAGLERLARRLGLGDRVRFLGHVSGVATALRGYDALLLASRYEGLPSVVLEALDAGLHVVAADCCCSMRALLDGGALGTVVPPDDEDAFAAAIAAAPHGQRAPGRARAAAARHRIDRIAPFYLRLFRRLAGSAGGGAVRASRPPRAVRAVRSDHAEREYAL